MCVIADGSGAIGLGGVMGGESTGSHAGDHRGLHRERLVRSRSAPPRPAATLGIVSDAQYRFARGVDPGFVVPGLELATRLILEICGGEASEVDAGRRRSPRRRRRSTSIRPMSSGCPASTCRRDAHTDDPRRRSASTSRARGFSRRPGGATSRARPTWSRRWRASPATTPCRPSRCRRCAAAGQRRAHARARAASAPRGGRWPRPATQEALTWSFIAAPRRRLFGGGAEALVLDNPISRRARLHAPLDPARPDRGGGPQRAARLSRLRPCSRSARCSPATEPADQRTAIAAILGAARAAPLGQAAGGRRLRAQGRPVALLDELGAPVGQPADWRRATPRPGGGPAAPRACSWARRRCWPSSARSIPRC